MKKTIITLALVTGAMLFSNALIAQGYTAKNAPDANAKPVLANEKDLGNKKVVESVKPIPPPPPVAPPSAKALQQDANKTNPVSEAPVFQAKPDFRQPDNIVEVPPKENVLASKQNTAVVSEAPKPPVISKPVVKTLPVKNN